MTEDEDAGSMVDPKEYQTPKTPQQGKDSNYKLWELLEQIRDAIKENSVAINNLVSTAFMNRPTTQQPDRPMPKPVTPPTPLFAAEQPLPKKTTSDPISKIEGLFPEDIASMLEFKLDNGVVVIKPRQFLGSDIFAKVASVVRGANGEYVSAGKMSHFKVPV